MATPFHNGNGFSPHRRLPEAAPPHARRFWLHALLFVVTAASMTLAGATLAIETLPEPALPEPSSLLEAVLSFPIYYLASSWLLVNYVIAHPALLSQGAMFAGSLLAILSAHEAGHYFACRLYRVEASLPYFIPAPPLFLAGTFGAFIRIRSPIPSRRALFDIAVAGPLAGFAVAVPIAMAGVAIAQPALSRDFEPGTMIMLNDPLLMRAFGYLFGVELTHTQANPLYFAAWIGLLVTSLNLLPVGQLDGGHIVYALFGRRAHALFGKMAFGTVLLLALLGWEWHGTPSGLVYALLLLIILRLPHPPVMQEDDALGTTRTLLAWLTLAVFILCFLPFPITIR